MRISLIAATWLATLGIVCFTTNALGQAGVAATPRVATSSPAAAPISGGDVIAAQPLKFSFLLFWKDNNPKVQQMAEILNASSAKRPARMEWSSVNVRDAANQALVERYQVGRMPMPLVLCVASNGAVTGAYTVQFNEAAVDRSMVTPAMAEATKALQEKRIVLLHIKPSAESPLPNCASEFAADPDFSARTTIVKLVSTDPAEARFLTDMKLTSIEVRDPLLVVMAPPAVLVGKFAAGTTKDQIVTQLHAAGKCCDDPNCKHNRGARQ